MKALLILILTLLSIKSVCAYKFSYDFNKTPVSEALAKIAKEHADVNLSFIYTELTGYLNSSTIRTDDPYEAIKLTIGKNPVKVTEKKGLFFVEALQHGTYRYSGKVIGDDNQPVIAATVMLIAPKDSIFLTYGMTDEKGCFLIPCDHKDVIVKLSSLGYQPTCINSISFDLGTIRMESLPVNLNSVHVMADRIRKRNDGMVITPRKRDLEFATNAYDVLENIMIPGISIDRKNSSITRLGSEVSVYIDGRRSDSDDMEGLPPGSIKKIEYIDVTSGKYIREDAVINIITNRNDGSHISVDVLQNLTYEKGKYIVKAQQTSGTTTFSASAYIEQAKYTDNKGGIYESYRIGDVSFDRNASVRESPTIYDNEFFRFRVKDNRDNRSLSAAMSMRRSHTPDSRYINLISYDYGGNISESLSTSSIKDNSLSPTFDLSGEFSLSDRSVLNVTANGSYSHNKYSSSYDEGSFSSISDVKEGYWTVFANANYSRKYGKSAASIDMIENFQKSNAEYSGTYPSIQDMNTNELIANIGYMAPIGKYFLINLRAGISWIRYHLKRQSKTSRSVPRGSLMLRYMPGSKHTVSLNFNAGNSYPTASTLNSADQVVNEFLLKQGNPSYKPSLLLNSALMYGFFSHRFNMQALYINNIITHMLLPHYYAEGNKVIYTFDNSSTLYQNMGVFFGTIDIGSGATLKTELAVIDNRFSKSLIDSHHATFRASLDLSYTWKKLMLSAGFKAKEKELTSAGVMSESFNTWRCSVRYILTDWLFEIGAENLFSKANYLRNTYQSETYSYQSDIYDRTHQSNVYAKVTFRIDRGKKQKISGLDAEESQSSAILK
ncbi:MAG: hypothetical protein K2N48_03225 [Muribaculaceae bacterium]|nr:hypothetical protein [Muribaculaceae bacterium]